jgi:hypothetical protein
VATCEANVIFELNGDVVWHWGGTEWAPVCSAITSTTVYHDPSGRFFELGFVDGAGREFRIQAEKLFHHRIRNIQWALQRENVEIFDLMLTTEYLRGSIPSGAGVTDPNITPRRTFGANAEFRRAWMKARGHVVYV